ncbi:hypothetical protein DXA63_16880, partial [Segatella copri]
RTEILVPIAAIQAVPIAVIVWYRLHRYAWYRYSAIVKKVRTHVNIYEDSIRYHNEMIQMAAIKDSIANSLFKEVNEIKKKINQK